MTDAGGEPLFLPLDGGGFRLSLGLRRLPAGQWIEVDDTFEQDRAARRRLIDDADSGAVAWMEGEDVRTACAETVAALARHLGAQRAAIEDSDLRHPIIAAGRLVADDVCVLDGTSLRLIAAAVCFPNRWRLSDKIGCHVSEVHGVVPGYAAELVDKVVTVLERLRLGQVLERRNWSVVDDPTLHQPAAGPPTSAGDQAWARVERQTLTRLPASRAIIFTIRTRQRRLADLGQQDRAALTAVLATLPADMAAYKGIRLA